MTGRPRQPCFFQVFLLFSAISGKGCFLCPGGTKLKSSFTILSHVVSCFRRHPTRVCQKKNKKKCFLLEIPRSGENLKKKSTTTFFPLQVGPGLRIFFQKKNQKKSFLLEILRSGENLKKKSTTTFSPRCLGHPKGGRVSGGQFGVFVGGVET